MSLFSRTGRDVSIPLLTQVYQLDTSNLQEVEEFLRRRRNFSEGWHPTAEDKIVAVCRMVQLIMTILADEGSVNTLTDEQIGQMNVLLSDPELTQPRALVRACPGRGPVSIHFHFVGLSDDQQVNLYAGFLLDELFVLLSDPREIARMKRCSRCNSVFLVAANQRNRQQYCSHRCTSGANIRRRREGLTLKVVHSQDCRNPGNAPPLGYAP